LPGIALAPGREAPASATEQGDCQMFETFARWRRLIFGFIYMKFFFKFRRFAVLAAVLMLAGIKAEAQGLVLSVTNSASSIQTSNFLTYTINVTNFLGDLSDAMVTNTLPASVQFVDADPSFGGDFTNFGSVVVFDIGEFDLDGVAQMSLTVQPTAAGFITNMVVLYTIDVTNTAATNVVTQVTNNVIQADLGVAITVPTTAVVVNDLMAYGVSVTNAGPNDAPDVVFTNTLPPGVILKGVSPTNQTFTTVASNLIFNLGTLTSGTNKTFQFSIQPTNAGALNFFVAVGAAGILDTNTANNSVSNSIPVINYLPGQLLAFTNSAQIVNFQNGLLEQFITLTNIGTNGVAAARVVVTGLTNRLFNASGTNNGNPFVTDAATLGINQSVNLLLQYFPRNLFPFTNGQLQAFAVPVPDLTPPPASSTSTNLNITRIVRLSNGNMLVEFPSITNRTYTVVYSDNVSFFNAMIAPPAIVAPANEIQWIDYGPPTTTSAPTNSAARFYRVFLNP
jgi:uncharacterized repeat protein (TIGR01451 family)